MTRRRGFFPIGRTGYCGEKLNDSLRAQQRDHLQHNKEVNIPSITTDDRQVAAALDYVYGLAQQLGLRACVSDDRSVVTAEAGQGEETVGILVHVGVVDPLDVNAWTTPPFEADYRDGRVYGRRLWTTKGR